MYKYHNFNYVLFELYQYCLAKNLIPQTPATSEDLKFSFPPLLRGKNPGIKTLIDSDCKLYIS